MIMTSSSLNTDAASLQPSTLAGVSYLQYRTFSLFCLYFVLPASRSPPSFPLLFLPPSSSWSPRHKGSLNSLQATQAHATRQRTESLNGAARSEFASIADGGAGKITPINNAWDEPRSWQTSTKQSSTTLDALEFMSEQDASPQTSQNSATSPGTSKDKKGESRSGLERLQSLVPLQIITSVEEARDITVAEGKVTVLLAVIPKKLYAKPMFEILSRLVKNVELAIMVLDGNMLLKEAVETWPKCDCLIAFHASGYPLEKAQVYAKLHKPFVINDLEQQHVLKDRRDVYAALVANNIPVPQHVVITADRTPRPGEYTPDQIELRGDKLCFKATGAMLLKKPFVEKPCSAEDHNVYVYFSAPDGGGCQRIFRKSKDRSSEYFPGEQPLREGGSYMYERFVPSGGTDIKVYTVTGLYAHAEGRKSPVVDGSVLRDGRGKELRCPILLNASEKAIAKRVVEVFRQNICGLDLLRSEGGSFVCDVNGWSFVKSSTAYHDDCAQILRNLMLHRSKARHPGMNPLHLLAGPAAVLKRRVRTRPELLCVIAVVRHGERTPKQKMKTKVTQPSLLNLFARYGNPRKELKLKSREELTAVLEVAERLVGMGAEEDEDMMQDLRQIVNVLRMYPLEGINRKVQLKPLAWGTPETADSHGGSKMCKVEEIVTKAELVLKWGGELTQQGKAIVQTDGIDFREQMYEKTNGIGVGPGLLRLHSTFRHDLKVYSSTEGRVQLTAAAFAKGMLGLGGGLPPILASLVRYDDSVNLLLDDCSKAKPTMDKVKKRLHTLLQPDCDATALIPKLCTLDSTSISTALEEVKNPRARMATLHAEMTTLGKLLDTVVLSTEEVRSDDSSVLNMRSRWQKLINDFYKAKKESYDISKVPDIFDAIKHDCRHNSHKFKDHLDVRSTLWSIHNLVKSLADIVVPLEYGVTEEDKMDIAANISKPLRNKIVNDMRSAANMPATKSETSSDQQTSSDQHNTAPQYNPKGAGFLDSEVKSPDRNVRSRLYFTSESHVHALLSFLRFGGYEEVIKRSNPGPGHTVEEKLKIWREGMAMLSAASEANFLTKIVLRLFESPSVPEDVGSATAGADDADSAGSESPAPPQVYASQYFVEWLVSTGQELEEDSGSADTPGNTPGVMPMTRLHIGASLEDVEEFLARFDEYSGPLHSADTLPPRSLGDSIRTKRPCDKPGTK